MKEWKIILIALRVVLLTYGQSCRHEEGEGMEKEETRPALCLSKR